MMKKILLAIGIVCMISKSSRASVPASAEGVEMYVFFTPSHEHYYLNWFLPSLEDPYTLVKHEIDQVCKDGQFMHAGWKQTVIQKVDMIIKAVRKNWGKVFVYSDVDIQFFRPTWKYIAALMEKHDIAIQKDSPSGTKCTGFFACWGNERTLKFWQEVRGYLAAHLNSKKLVGDQRSFNQVLRENPQAIRCCFLPTTFMSGGTLTSKQWRPGKKLPVPQDIVLHHANWTSGKEHKVKQLEYVKQLVEQRSRPKQDMSIAQ